MDVLNDEAPLGGQHADSIPLSTGMLPTPLWVPDTLLRATTTLPLAVISITSWR